jgi:hypothetical protein
MRATTMKRKIRSIEHREWSKQARRERLAHRLVERRMRWQARQSRTTVALGGLV